MKNLVIVALLAAGAFLAWKKFKPADAPPPAVAADGNTLPAGDAKNRIDNLSGGVSP